MARDARLSLHDGVGTEIRDVATVDESDFERRQATVSFLDGDLNTLANESSGKVRAKLFSRIPYPWRA